VIPTFRQVEEEVGQTLREQGGLGAILVDLAPLARIDPLIIEMKDRFRDGDMLTRDEREGDRFVLFLGGHRDGGSAFSAADLRKLADRVEEFLTPRIGRLTLPYLRERPNVDVGYGFVPWSPIESEERQVLRLIEDTLATAELRRRLRERYQREALLEIIHNRQVWTAFQEINELTTRAVMGHEALSRGPRGTELEPPMALFGSASRHGLQEELERACRRQAFVDWEVFGGQGRLFVNTVPATIRDPSFLGRGVFDYLGPNLSPRFVTLEITERQVIENLSLYREAMHAFLELGFSFAIDDLGAGYSGLETVATLGAAYLKIDMGLVRDVHQKRASQQIIKAIVDMGAGVSATIIAEGIQSKDEAAAITQLGIRYGQGYLFARPIDPYAVQRRPTVVQR
jgi:EAL domain-containing protein (putative c-di-GMP-specific phosphodiesterase class I)